MAKDNLKQQTETIGKTGIRKLNPSEIKKDFPIFKNNPKLVYLDSTATSQKPKIVIDALVDFYENYNANIHRSINTLSEKSSAAYESVREKVAKFINAQSLEEIVFTRSTTESINLVAYSWGMQNLKEQDEIVVSLMEHHSNFVPWQQIAKMKKNVLKVVGITKDGLLDMADLETNITKKTKIVAITHCSNVLGTINDVDEIAKIVRKRAHPDAVFVVDGAQSVPHMPIDVQKIDCDFLAFSAHKMLGPTGVGVLYGKKELLSKLNPFNFGGGMVLTVKTNDTTFKEAPWKFEAGTVNIADVIAFGKAIDYLSNIGMEAVRENDIELTKYAISKLSEVKGLKLYGSKDAEKRSSVVAFNLADIHPHDLSTVLDDEGIAIRGGNHCAQPLMQKLGVTGTARASFYIYNTKEDVDKLVKGIEKVKKVFDVTF